MSNTYVTKQGDMWDSIAFAQLGDDIHADKLVELNRKYVSYYVFPEGIELTLPEIPPDNPAELPPWKRVAE